jgi:hypothetical protein
MTSLITSRIKLSPLAITNTLLRVPDWRKENELFFQGMSCVHYLRVLSYKCLHPKKYIRHLALEALARERERG